MLDVLVYKQHSWVALFHVSLFWKLEQHLTVNATSQVGGFQIRSNLGLLSPKAKEHGVFNNKNSTFHLQGAIRSNNCMLNVLGVL